MKNTSKKIEWKITCNRFVAYFDIMGFKDLVARSKHEEILKKLYDLRDHLEKLGEQNYAQHLKKISASKSETKSFIFSDSIVFFSKGDSIDDAVKIIFDSLYFLYSALELQIPIKGALSFGEMTVDLKKSIFFGQPIIDAITLHEDLNLYGIILEHHFEKRIAYLKSIKNFNPNTLSYLDCIIKEKKISLKSGQVKHCILCPPQPHIIENQQANIKKLYTTMSGGPRKYLDNTLEFLDSLLLKK